MSLDGFHMENHPKKDPYFGYFQVSDLLQLSQEYNCNIFCVVL